MTTRAQSLYIDAYPNKSHDFEDNEDFLQFRDHLLFVMSAETLDAEVVSLNSKPKTKVTSGTIYRRAYNVLRRRLESTTQLSHIQRLLYNEIYICLQQLGDIEDEQLLIDWKTQIQPLLDQKKPLEKYKDLVTILTKMNILSGKGSMEKFLRATKETNEESEEDNSDDSFKIPK